MENSTAPPCSQRLRRRDRLRLRELYEPRARHPAQSGGFFSRRLDGTYLLVTVQKFRLPADTATLPLSTFFVKFAGGKRVDKGNSTQTHSCIPSGQPPLYSTGGTLYSNTPTHLAPFRARTVRTMHNSRLIPASLLATSQFPLPSRLPPRMYLLILRAVGDLFTW